MIKIKRAKIGAFVLFFTASLLLVMTAQAANYQHFPDVPDDAPYAYEINILKEAGIFSGDGNGNFLPDKTMTRAEAATLMVKLFVGELEPSEVEVTFTDVVLTHWAYDYIRTAVEYGLISGYGDGRFGPNDELTYEQAVALLIKALGYEEAAQELGGWPNGYLHVGNELGITENAYSLPSASVLRSIIAKLIYNAIA